MPLLSQYFRRNVEELVIAAHTHTRIHTKVNYSGLRIGGLVHTIHNHLETTANASTKAKLKVEPLNSLISSLFLSHLQMVLDLKSSIFF